MYVTRKLTGQVVGQDVPAITVELYLSCLPNGVYGLENDYGVEVAECRVRRGRVSKRPVGTLQNEAAGG